MSKSVERVIKIIDVLAERPATLATLAADFRVDRSTMSRIMQVLEREDYVRRRADGTYVVGYRLLGLAHGGFDQVELRKAAYVPLRQLQQITGTTVHLAELVGNGVLYIDKAESLDGVGLYARIGQPLPPYCTAVGKAILANLPANEQDAILSARDWVRYTSRTLGDHAALDEQLADVRTRGWAVDDREFDDLVNCVAVPILSAGRPVGAISVTSIQSVCDVAALTKHVPIMIRMAGTVSAALPRQVGSRP
jgi:DNA-binding IclR family transcriptional regulator